MTAPIYWTREEREAADRKHHGTGWRSASREEWDRILATVDALEKALMDVSRVLEPTDPSAFSATDERRRIASAQVLIACALVPLTGEVRK